MSVLLYHKSRLFVEVVGFQSICKSFVRVLVQFCFYRSPLLVTHYEAREVSVEITKDKIKSCVYYS